MDIEWRNSHAEAVVVVLIAYLLELVDVVVRPRTRVLHLNAVSRDDHVRFTVRRP